MASITRQDVVDFLSGLTPLEVRALVAELEERWEIERPHDGREFDHTMGLPVFPEYGVTLVDAGPRRVQVMRVLREAIGGSLVEVRALVDGAPRSILERAERRHAEELALTLRQVGAIVEITESTW